MQQSALRVHGARDDDKTRHRRTVVNWPGGGGGLPCSITTRACRRGELPDSAIPAEVMTGGIFMNMVTKSGSNPWRGDVSIVLRHRSWQSSNDAAARAAAGWRVPVTRLYDFNVAGGGEILRDRLWVNGSYRNWRTDKLTLVRNSDGSRAIDDNLIWNVSGKGSGRPRPGSGRRSPTITTGRSASTAVTPRRIHRRPRVAVADNPRRRYSEVLFTRNKLVSTRPSASWTA